MALAWSPARPWHSRQRAIRSGRTFASKKAAPEGSAGGVSLAAERPEGANSASRPAARDQFLMLDLPEMFNKSWPGPSRTSRGRREIERGSAPVHFGRLASSWIISRSSAWFSSTRLAPRSIPLLVSSGIFSAIFLPVGVR